MEPALTDSAARSAGPRTPPPAGPDAPPAVELRLAQLLERVPARARVLCLGLPGPAAEVCRELALRRDAELPWLLDRTPVLPADVAAGPYRRRDVGRARDRALCAVIARQTERVLPLGQGEHPETWLVQRVCRDRRRREEIADGVRDPRSVRAARGLARAEDRGLPSPRRSAPVEGWLGRMVARFDLVLQVLEEDLAEHWEPPVAPETPVLQMLLDHGGRLRGPRPGDVPWAARACRECAVAELLGRPVPDCLCRLAGTPSGAEPPGGGRPRAVPLGRVEPS